MAKIENKLLAIIRVRGRVNVRQSISETLNRLNLRRVNNLVLVYADKSATGMVHKCKDFVTFGEIDAKTLERLLKKRAEKEVPKADIEAVIAGKKKVKDMGVRMPLRLSPPKRGFKSVKHGYNDGGDLGYRGAKINELISRMA